MLQTDINIRFYHGRHETQDARCEADLKHCFNQCDKNKDHNDFIPVKLFSMQHPPPDYEDEVIVNFVKVLSSLTLWINVRKTSPSRPSYWPGTSDPYPYFNSSDMDRRRFGTGRIQTMSTFTKELGIPCPCSKCKMSQHPSKSWAEVRIHTATHVIFDNLEAESTICRLFYDDNDQQEPEIALFGFNVEMADVDRDRCRLVCVTCDVKLIRTISKLLKKHYKLWRLLYKKYEKNQEMNKLTIIVSHPHGCSKHVTVGDWAGRYTFGRSSSKYTYTTSTCPGSSGAPVYRLGNGGWHERVHSGVDTEGANYSSTGIGRPTFSEIVI
ncbi:hypothetical protein Btru_023012 [Bulinus truncatus]|nr:hypothetical protein Btru_023012 [Bulinus truncatus]